jgi:signal transduction histidine kinase
VIDMTLQTLGRDLQKDRIRLTVSVDDDLTARCNPNQLEQVLFNLLLNARQAILPKPGSLTLEAEPAGDNAVILRVRDNGPGITPANLERIFTPFFSTKRNADRPDRRGIGLGLAVCRQMVESWGGEINVESTVGEGTTFTLTLPTID